MTKIADLIHVPEYVHSGDFVLKLVDGVNRAESTLRNYVVTEQLVKCFDQSLRLIQSAIESESSMAAYLHGSFGSGKSHFMAVLSLLLQGNTEARSRPELAAVINKHNEWTTGKRILVVPFHLIGAENLESAVLGQYARYIRSLHPEAPTPGFYRSEKLFEDARGIRRQLGDEKFFEVLGSGNGDEDWGEMGGQWDAESFDSAISAEPGSEDRARVIGDLIDSFFKAQSELAVGKQEGFTDLDEGLVILSRHARALGYDAVVLFLDELILWLASHAADPAWVSREGQKVAKLVEASRLDRALPIVSFIARQRDLRELVGEHLPGADQLGFADVLNWWEARFETITLEDRNLPEIIEKRLLRPKDDQAQQHLTRAFEETAHVRKEVFDILLTREGDREMFRKVYPFSPALVSTLIAISSLLQRERTALKLLVQLLVDQRDSLELGHLVPVGDLYDVIESGDEPFAQAMKLRFDQARHLLRNKLLPLLEEHHGVTATEVADGTAPPDKAKAFRNEARLMKTLILSTLAEGVEVLKGITPSKLAALNHGTVRTPIPNAESQVVLQRVRAWAARVGEIKVSDDSANPLISIHLVGVDTEGVLENAKFHDNHGNRIQKVRHLLHEMTGLPPDDSLYGTRYAMPWKGTQREIEVLFRPVRELPLDSFAPDDAEWRLVIDYPFDPGRSRRDATARLQEHQQGGETIRSLVWIPAFLNFDAGDELGRLVVLDHVLTGNKLDEYGAHLSQLDREQARIILANQRDQVRQRVKNALLAAYGVTSTGREVIDSAHEPDSYFHSLDPGFRPQPPVAANFKDAMDNLLDQALRYRYPAHPEFGGEVKPAALRRVLGVVTQAASKPDRRVEVDRPDRDDMRRIAVPLKLGQMGESPFVLGEDWVREFEQKLAREDNPDVTVRKLRELMDQPRRRGLPTQVGNLVIITFALQTNRSFFRHGGPFDASLDNLPGEVELRKQPLPDEAVWEKAVDVAGHVMGISAAEDLNASNVAKLTEQAIEIAGEKRDACSTYTAALAARLSKLGIPEQESDRLKTARAVSSLLTSVAGAEREKVVEVLAGASISTSETAMGTAMKFSPKLRDALERMRWGLLDNIDTLPEPYAAKARTVAESVRHVLKQDEHVEELAARLKTAEDDLLRILQEAAASSRPTDPEAGPPPPTTSSTVTEGRKVKVRAPEVDRVISEIRDEARRNPDAWMEVEWKILNENGS